MENLLFRDLGTMSYREAWDYQESLMQRNLAVKAARREAEDEGQTAVGDTRHYLLFVEHPPVFTLGKSGNEGNVLMSEEHLKRMGIEYFRTNRGGDITFHGPEQLVGYPILDLEKFYTDIGRYLRNIEEVIIRTLGDYGLKGDRSKGETGVWLDPEIKGKERKICAIGVRSSRWITMHGFALNVNTNLDYFNMIVPCGIPDKQVTSLEKELGHKVEMAEVKERVAKHFESVFEAQIQPWLQNT